MPDPSKQAQAPQLGVEAPNEKLGGAVGAGLVLVVMPGTAMVLCADRLASVPAVGLPVLAIFGIIMLFGALALVSTLFRRLGLSNKREALALPAGSVRAAIALSLLVLFALLSVMLYESFEKNYEIEYLSADQKEALLKEPRNIVTAVIPQICPSPAPGNPPKCTAGAPIFTVHIRQAPATEASDFAKQLLVLIGTLMTSVTSFYFAAKTSEATTKAALEAIKQPGGDAKPAPGIEAAADDPAAADPEAHQDGCNVAVTDPTDDKDLPPAMGGVAS